MYLKSAYSVTMRDVAKKMPRILDVPRKEEIKLTQKIFNDFFDLIMDKIIEEGYGYDIPYQFGKLYLRAVYDRKSVNVKKTVDTKIRTYHPNIVSGGYVYKIIWQKYYNFPNVEVVSFKKSQMGRILIGKKINNLINQRRLPLPFEKR